jgi:hypothetical protein
MAGWVESSWKKNHLFRSFSTGNTISPESTSDLILYARYYSDQETVQGATESSSTQVLYFGLDASDVPLLTGSSVRTDSLLRYNTNSITFTNEYSPQNPALGSYSGLNLYHRPSPGQYIFVMKLRFQTSPTSVGSELIVPVDSIRIQID